LPMGSKEGDFNLKEVLEETLMEIRGLISELENPFNILPKYLKDLPLKEDEEPVGSGAFAKASSEKPEARGEGGGDSEEGGGFEREEDFKRGLEGVAAVLTARILSNLFGGTQLESVLYTYYEKGLVPEESISLVRKGMRLLKEGDGIGIDSHLLAVSLLKKLVEEKEDPFFIFILMAMNQGVRR